MRKLILWGCCSALVGCVGNDDDARPGILSASAGEDAGTSESGGDDDDGATGPLFDVGSDDDDDGPDGSCKVIGDEMDAPGDCEAQAPPDSFTPQVQWTWTGEVEPYSIVTPLVGNLTDDDDSGQIDLCDVPDVVVVASTFSGQANRPGHIYVLDGETGAEHFRIETEVDHTVTPALGDIDGDGQMEIVAGLPDGYLAALEHDGTPKWVSSEPRWSSTLYNGSAIYGSALALADLDNDGDVEIVAADFVTDHHGELLLRTPERSGSWSATAVADLDDDGDQEIVLGHAAYHHDGTPSFVSSLAPGYPQIANLDDDAEPEILLTNEDGISILEHDGTVKLDSLRPTGVGPGGTVWLRPATVHDFDGDGVAEFAVSSATNYTVYEPDASIHWNAQVTDLSGIAAGTAFDFLGDGIAEAMYADEDRFFIFDGTGASLLSIERTSGTLTEYPVVADLDNDGSAEVAVVSNEYQSPNPSPTVQVIRDAEDRWIQARRIWNQHTYHVTNVREDGRIPSVELPSWQYLNTYRTNAQIEGGGVCKPVPEG